MASLSAANNYYLRKLALGRCELELLRKPSPLGDERGEFEGGWAVVLNGTNPAFPRAIPHGTVIID